jgi:hypothetical protein
MDIISHGLWGGIALGRKKRNNFIYAFIFSVLPDVLAEGIMFCMIYFGVNNMPDLEHGHPNISEFPVYAQNFYNTTHSLLVFIAVFIFIWVIRKKPFCPLLAWAFHIILDIPTHSFELFPTPFLWPVSDIKVNGIPWHSSIIMIPDIILLVVFYIFWLYNSKTYRISGNKNT